MSANTAQRSSNASRSWIAIAGLSIGIGGMLALVAVALLLPVDAEAGLQAASQLRTGPGDLEIRSAGILIFFAVTAALFVSSATPSGAPAGREPAGSDLETGSQRDARE